jgi:hypothetical protein
MFRNPLVEFVALLLLGLAGGDHDRAIGLDLVAGDRDCGLARLLGDADERRLARLARLGQVCGADSDPETPRERNRLRERYGR